MKTDFFKNLKNTLKSLFKKNESSKALYFALLKDYSEVRFLELDLENISKYFINDIYKISLFSSHFLMLCKSENFIVYYYDSDEVFEFFVEDEKSLVIFIKDEKNKKDILIDIINNCGDKIDKIFLKYISEKFDIKSDLIMEFLI